MISQARQSKSKEFMVATETGILHRMRKESPDKTFLAVKEDAVCQYMKMIDLIKVRNSMRNLVCQIRVEKSIAERARLSIQRMLDLA